MKNFARFVTVFFIFVVANALADQTAAQSGQAPENAENQTNHIRSVMMKRKPQSGKEEIEDKKMEIKNDAQELRQDRMEMRKERREQRIEQLEKRKENIDRRLDKLKKVNE